MEVGEGGGQREGGGRERSLLGGGEGRRGDRVVIVLFVSEVKVEEEAEDSKDNACRSKQNKCGGGGRMNFLC